MERAAELRLTLAGRAEMIALRWAPGPKETAWRCVHH